MRRKVSGNGCKMIDQLGSESSARDFTGALVQNKLECVLCFLKPSEIMAWFVGLVKNDNFITKLGLRPSPVIMFAVRKVVL